MDNLLGLKVLIISLFGGSSSTFLRLAAVHLEVVVGRQSCLTRVGEEIMNFKLLSFN